MDVAGKPTMWDCTSCHKKGKINGNGDVYEQVEAAHSKASPLCETPAHRITVLNQEGQKKLKKQLSLHELVAP